MANEKKKAAVKTLDKKSMKSTRGGGVMIPDAKLDTGSTSDCRKAGGTQTDF